MTAAVTALLLGFGGDGMTVGTTVPDDGDNDNDGGSSGRAKAVIDEGVGATGG